MEISPHSHTPTHMHTPQFPLSAPAPLLSATRRIPCDWLEKPTQSSHTEMCCFASWSCLSGASVNRAIVWSALPRGFTPICPEWFAASLMLAWLFTVQSKALRGQGWGVGVSERCRRVGFYCQTTSCEMINSLKVKLIMWSKHN